MRKFLDYLKGWRGIALVSYVWLIIMGWVIVYVDIASTEMRRRFYLVSVAEIVLVIALYVCPRLLSWAEDKSIKPDTPELTPAQLRKFFFKAWAATFGILFVMCVIFYPGGYGGDALHQFEQALGLMGYWDWHPVLNTLFGFTLPLRLTGNWMGAPLFFQALTISLSLAYMAVTVMQYGRNKKYIKNFMIYIMLNPSTLLMFLFQPKDGSFSTALLVAMTMAVKVYFTKGEWLRNIFHASAFMIVIVAGTFFRHNGVLFTLPLLLAMSVFVKKRQMLLMLVAFGLMVYGVKYPLYESLNVRKPDRRKIETLGVAISMIGSAVTESPKYLDKDILDFAYSIAPKEIWEEKFNLFAGYDSIKSAEVQAKTAEEKEKLLQIIHLEKIEEAGYLKVLNMAWRCLKEAPLASLRGFAGITSVVYGIAGPPAGRIVPRLSANNLGLKDNQWFNLNFIYGFVKKILSFSGATQGDDDYRANGENGFRFTGVHEGGTFTLQSLIILIYYVELVLFKHLIWCIGVLMLVIIIFALAKLDFSKIDSWKKLVLILPIFVHNYGTMLLLQGNHGLRFFYYTYTVLPLVLLVLLKDNTEVKS